MPENQLQLNEKQKGYGTIISVFGPDGGGKSFSSPQLAAEFNATIIEGTHPEKWELSHHEKRKLKLVEDAHGKGFGSEYYGFLAKMLHEHVLKYAKAGTNIVIEGDQTFKWLMWEDYLSNYIIKDGENRLEQRINELKSKKFNAVLPNIIRYVVPEADSIEEQVELIWQNLQKKDITQRSSIDPKSRKEVMQQLESSQRVILALEKLGVVVEGKPGWLK